MNNPFKSKYCIYPNCSCIMGTDCKKQKEAERINQAKENNKDYD